MKIIPSVFHRVMGLNEFIQLQRRDGGKKLEEKKMREFFAKKMDFSKANRGDRLHAEKFEKRPQKASSFVNAFSFAIFGLQSAYNSTQYLGWQSTLCHKKRLKLLKS